MFRDKRLKSSMKDRSLSGLGVMVHSCVCIAMGVLVGDATAAPPANDLCENAEIITSPGTYSRNNHEATGGDVTQPGNIQCSVFPDGSDVWFRVPGGAFPRQFQLALLEPNMTQFPPTMTLYTACPSGPGEFQVACGRTQAFLGSPGQDYYIRVAFDDAFQNVFDLVINWYDITTPLPGDTCSSPLATLSAGSTVTGNTTGYSGDDVSTCAQLDTIDVWYQFVVGAGQGGTYVIDTFGSSFDTTLAIYSRCPQSVADGLVACDDDYRAEDPLFQDQPNLQSQIGTYLGEGTYLIRISGYNNARGAYSLYVSPRAAPIAGDHCTNALPLRFGLIHASTTGLTGHTVAPYSNVIETACSLNDRTDIWYSFTTPIDGVYTFTMEYEFVEQITNFFGTMRFYDACFGSLFGCREYDRSGVYPSVVSGFLPGGNTYLIRIAGYNGREGDFTLKVDPPEGYCAADFNISGSVTVQDIFDFLAAWFAGSASADFNSTAGVTVQDIFDFLAAWFAGC